MLAWILKTKPENLSESTGISRGAPPKTDWRGCGGTESRRKPSRSSWMPKLLTALPK
jgi:hypothetical protein